MEYSRAYLKRLAKARARGKESWGRNWNEKAFYIGLTGEAEFARTFNCEIDTEINDGDGGIDFTHPEYTIDVKTYEKAYNLFLETDRKCRANILVLARYDPDSETAQLLGWEFATNMLKCPLKQFHPKGPVNHYKPAKRLRQITELLDILKGAEV